MRMLIVILGMLVSCFPAMGLDAHLVSDKEMAGLLPGCWRQELAPDRNRLSSEHFDVCFGAQGALTMPIVTCNTQHGCSEDVGRGSYSLAEAKLVIKVPDDWGFVFRRPNLLCDVLISPGNAIKLTNCVGSGGWNPDSEFLPDTSYAFVNGARAND